MAAFRAHGTMIAAWARALVLILCSGRPHAAPAPRSLCARDPAACEPVILVPGLMSSRLYRVNASLHTDVLNGGSAPPLQQRIWLPPFLRLTWASAMFNTPEHKAWLAELMSYEGDGVRVEPDRGEHGLKGVACVLKMEEKKCKMEAKVFWDLIRELKRVGYKPGLNLFAVPYDWRRRPEQNTFCRELDQALQRASPASVPPSASSSSSSSSSISSGSGPGSSSSGESGGANGGGGGAGWGGGAHIVAHSLGALQTLSCLNNEFGLSQLMRVKSFIAIAAPLGGSPKSLKTLFSGAEVLSR
jgi:uncharacterized membrane protein YgcG